MPHYPWEGGNAKPMTEIGFTNAKDLLDCEPELIWAVASVESSGCGFFPDARPKIRFEHSVYDGYANDFSLFGQGNGYGVLVNAYQRHPEAAMKATSWGIGQIMGFHAELIGYRTVGVAGMIRAFSDFEDDQLMAMAYFCMKTGAADHLRKFNFKGFAHLYNGPDFRRNQYDTKLEAAFERYRKVRPDIGVRAEQMHLMYRGLYRGPIDGIYGSQLQEARAKSAAVSQA